MSIAILGSALAGAEAGAQTPLFTFVQISDSQQHAPEEQLLFEGVLETVMAAGMPQALLPHPVDLVIFPGDCVWTAGDEDQWILFTATMDSRLTANGIPFFAVPGNHDQDNGGLSNYEQYVADAGVWAVGAEATAHNGLLWSVSWAGMRFVGFNNSYESWNNIAPQDLVQIESLVDAACAAGENVFLVGHHPHDGQGLVPLAAILEAPCVVGYMRGHSGNPEVQHGLSGIANPSVWDFNSNAIAEEGAILYFEVHPTEIEAYVIELTNNPTELPVPETIPLAHALTATAIEPVAAFSATPLSGPAPLAVSFSDDSAGNPTEWTWDFGDGEGSSEQHPQHVYDEPGTYSIRLDVANEAGADSAFAPAYINVGPPVPTDTFLPVADARVRSAQPDSNYGDSTELRCRDGSLMGETHESYLKFDVSGLEGPITAATLRLFTLNGSDDGGTLYVVSSAWTEAGITYANAPPMTGTPVATVGSIGNGVWVELDVASVVTGEGTYSFGLTNGSTNSVYYSSREGGEPPSLVIEMSATCGNGAVDPGEHCANCPDDVTCPPGTECQAGTCEVPCPWDLGGDGFVSTSDLLDLLSAWGTDPAGPPDFDGDGTVGTADLLDLLANWGAC